MTFLTSLRSLDHNIIEANNWIDSCVACIALKLENIVINASQGQCNRWISLSIVNKHHIERSGYIQTSFQE